MLVYGRNVAKDLIKKNKKIDVYIKFKNKYISVDKKDCAKRIVEFMMGENNE